jgi:hypothetical protein
MALDPAFRNELTGRREIFLLAAHHLNARHYYRLKTLEEPVSVRWIFL